MTDSSSQATSTLRRWLPTHLRMQRGSWLFLIVALVGLVAIGEGVRTLVRMQDTVAPGAYFNLRREVIPPLDREAREAGIVNETIIAVDGREVTSIAELVQATAELEPGAPVALTLEGARGTHMVTLRAFRPPLTSALLKFLAGALIIALGIGVFWFHPGRRESWPFLFACVSVGTLLVMSFALPRTTQTRLDQHVGIAAACLTGPLFLHLFLVFPRPLRLVVRHPGILIGIDVLALGFGLGAAVASLRVRATPFLVAAAIINAIAMTLVIASLVWRLRRPSSAEDRSKLRALLIAMVVAFPAPAAVGIIQTAKLGLVEHDPQGWTSMLLLSFPAIVGYAIVRRDLLQLDRTVARTAAVSAIVFAITGVFVVIALAVPRIVAPGALLGSPVAMGTIALGAFVALWPVQRRLVRVLQARFTGDLIERLAGAREVLADLADEQNPACFGRFERRVEEACDVSDAALLVRDGAAWRRPSTGEQVELTGRLVYELRRDGGVIGALAIGRPGAEVRERRELRQALAALGADVTRALGSGRKGEHIGDYKIERFLAAGGMGNIYIGAKHGAAGFVKPVAIKQLLPEMAVDRAAVERFLKEARLVARLTHPGIVQTLELGETERGYFIAMELVNGIDASTLLRRLRKRRQRLPLPLACHIVTSACMALDHAHRATDEHGEPLRLVHHDVTPHNLLVDGDGNVKLADFGVAHVRHDPALRGQLVGKIGYMAPEQLRGDALDQRVDVFAAGVVLYELVTGQHPFAAGSDFLTLSAIERGRFLPPETIREDCPRILALAIERALALEPDLRYPSAAAFADAIQAAFPLASRHAAELGALVRSVREEQPGAADSVAAPPAGTLTLPTARG